ncbi:ABC transporter permease [Paracrocinitomix mangrovi]|uniref:ABC transporter permease n=1 Tax=Paracrocinitomix mangrovi TaxID=2862509 RepID=UPI001EDAAA81|nr:FtsX-like permease family protein [Paracrocinitomix mangrovi]UKN03063.1 ABC transporter permease [Paracrocinitomix mangrovi]
MKTVFFIARRIMQGNHSQNRLSKPIVFISLTSIILGVAIMIISVSIVTGFQESIRNKVIGFGSHIQVTNLYDNSSMESSPILIDQDFYPELEENEENVKQIQIFAYKPAILQSKRDSVVFQIAGKDSLIDGNQEIMGVLFKGVDQDYDWNFFSDKIVEGRLIKFDSLNTEVLISKYIADKMGYKTGDEIESFFIMNNGPKKRKFKICGIYDTGFEEFDKEFIFTQIQHIQKLNNWGVQTFLTVRKDTCINDKFVLKSITTGGSGEYKYRWNGSEIYSDQDFILLNGRTEENIEVISTDFEREIYGLKTDIHSIPDTAIAKITVTNPCKCDQSTLAEQIDFISENEIKMPFGKIEIQNGKGTYNQYAGGFEIILENWEDLDKMDEIIYLNIPGYLRTKKITELQPVIFSWLDFLDINIIIIIVLILVVSLINMITSLLVMILEKTNMIGILKAIGASNKTIRQIFLMNSIFLLSRGLFWGNLLGIGLIVIQYYTGVFTLNPEVYYLDTVPVNLNIFHILLVNLLTIVVVRITLILPSFLITRIDPIKAIKFD